jgi:uncharacterized membrane protein
MIAAPAPTSRRVQSVDALRGAIMIVMAIDHIRDFIHAGAMRFSPTDLDATTPAVFLTRFITYFCAPVFVLTAGIGASLRLRRSTKRALSLFLLSRGLWLVVMELTILRFIIFFQVRLSGSLVLLLVIWALGLCMVVLAALVHLPARVVAVLAVVMVAGHNLFDAVTPAAFGRADWLWAILHRQAVFTVGSVSFLVAYPLVPWIGVMAAGYCLGPIFSWEPQRRQRALLRLGLALTAAFIVVRAVNRYGDPAAWTTQRSPLFTLLSFLNTTKYPPSLSFLLMTLGPALMLAAWLDRRRLSPDNPLIVFGRVPFFFYAAHFLLAHLVEVALSFLRYGKTSFLWLPPPSMGGPRELFPADYCFSLWVVYAVWIFVVVALYPACLWFSRLKQRRHDWWLSYL